MSGFFGGGGSSSYTAVSNYASLPSAGSVAANTIYAVLSGSGVWLINRKPAGFYISDGVSTWTYMSDFPDSFKDGNLRLYNSTDNTKIVALDASGLTTATTRTYAFPDKSGTFAMTSDITSASTITKTTNYTATTSDSIILVDATAGSVTITLYTAVGNQSKTLTVKKIDSSANTVTIDGNASETIDGSLTAVISVQNVSLSITSDNANWYVY